MRRSAQRDAAARTFEHVFTLDTPRDPDTWATVMARPVPEWTMDLEVVGKALSTLGKGMAPALFAKAQELGVPLPAELTEPGAELPPRAHRRRPAAGLPGTSSRGWQASPANPQRPEALRSSGMRRPMDTLQQLRVSSW